MSLIERVQLLSYLVAALGFLMVLGFGLLAAIAFQVYRHRRPRYARSGATDAPESGKPPAGPSGVSSPTKSDTTAERAMLERGPQG